MEAMSTKLDTGLQKASEAEQMYKLSKFKSAHTLYSESINFLEYAKKYEYPADVHVDLNHKIQEKIKIIKSMVMMCENAIQAHKNDPNNDNPSSSSSNHLSAQNHITNQNGENASAKHMNQKDPESDIIREKLKSLVLVEKPNVPMSRIAGLESVKSLLIESIDLPRRFPMLFKGPRKAWKGILFFGPPGTGKSFIAKAVATEVNCSSFYPVTSASVMSKFVGESQKIVKELFALAKQEATSENPAVIFFDEIDAFTQSRDDSSTSSGTAAALNELLVQMQGFSSDDNNIIVLAATNLPHKLDSAIRRRFEKRIYIPLPDKDARVSMFKMYLGKHNIDHVLSDVDIEEIAQISDGYSGADIEVVCRDALMMPLRVSVASNYFKKVQVKEIGEVFVACRPEDPLAQKMKIKDIPRDKLFLKPIKKSNVIQSLDKTKKTVTKEQLKIFEDYNDKFGC